ncbi:hypothetical protein LKR43_09630 [Pusillimonas sp. MFBS29]|uniref:hypothetical protein n=1 Tax=Pusillimonas sp. MFBS29 TaxID=2886690 RepID=UPI001D10736E|nr:hypothetical protein [Pusillimonas sp. MFBS29]MCC2596601.1 hypothetical protein [Pusillimonas sp. MFBS29]
MTNTLNLPSSLPDWSQAPSGWNWAAQDEDGRWFWYGVQPSPGIGGGVWRAPSRAQVFAWQGEPNPQWYDSLQQRPSTD